MAVVKLGMNESEYINHQSLLEENSVSEFSSSLEIDDIKIFSAKIEKLPEPVTQLKKYLQKVISKKALALMLIKSRKKRAEETFAPLLSQFPMSRYQTRSFLKQLQTYQYENNIDCSNSKSLQEVRLLDVGTSNLTATNSLHISKLPTGNHFIPEKNYHHQTKIAVKTSANEKTALAIDNRYLSQHSKLVNLTNIQSESLQISLNDRPQSRNMANSDTFLFEQNFKYDLKNELPISSQSILEQSQNEIIDYFSASNDQLEEGRVPSLSISQQNTLPSRDICQETLDVYSTKTQLSIYPVNEGQEIQKNSADKMKTTVGRRLIYTFSHWQDKPSVTFKFSEQGEKLLAITNNFAVHSALHESQHFFHCEYPLSVRYEDSPQDQHQPEQEDE
ncbi:hypothetical protein [Providencia sneebia]|uniref:Type III secretion protein n=1 Tax=Providencia sneebia DSM 19967 TaxID=1141660 RepID=K8WK40_9GAMM|nr:hypothetical protein [Providencia sneebia]EKT60894.1 type III secretion protein [Providencia sneebia DSM 19967]